MQLLSVKYIYYMVVNVGYMKIGAQDRKLLEILRKPDYWTPRITKIAHALGIPTSTAQSRLKRLERGGFFHGFGALTATDTSGFACFVVGKAADPGQTAPKLLSIGGVAEVHAISGESNLIVRFYSSDRQDYFTKVQQMRSLMDVWSASLSAKVWR